MDFLSQHTESLALLIDPEKYEEAVYKKQQGLISMSFDVILVGGSSDTNHKIGNCIKSLKENFKLPIYIFPGSHDQISGLADGILYLSLISGDNPKYLIGEHKKSAVQIKKSGIKVIPTGYILVDGGSESAVQKISETKPLNQTHFQEIIDVAVAGELLGMRAIYLEAGSGAKNVVSSELIEKMKNEIDIPLIVGGGIRTKKQIEAAFESGANLVVIGTLIEENIDNLVILDL